MSDFYDCTDFNRKDLDKENEFLVKALMLGTDRSHFSIDRERDDEGNLMPLKDVKPRDDWKTWEPVEREDEGEEEDDEISKSELFGYQFEDSDWAVEFWEKIVDMTPSKIHLWDEPPKKKQRGKPEYVKSMTLIEAFRRYGARMRAIKRGISESLKHMEKKNAEKKLRKRVHVYEEILTTERHYIRSLKMFLNSYVVPMDGLVKPELCTVLRKAVQNVLEINEPLLAMLEKCYMKTVGGEPVGVEDLFIANVQVFKLYVQYMEKYGKVLKMINDLGDDKRFQSFCTKVHEYLKQKGERATTIKSFLIMPVQRLPRYKLLLSELKKKTPPHDESYKKIERAVESVSGIADYINVKKKEIFARMKARTLFKRFKLKDLVHSSRKLVMSCDAVIDDEPGEVYVFNDLLAIVHQKKLHRVEPEDSAARAFKDKSDTSRLFVESQRFEAGIKFDNTAMCDSYCQKITEILQVQAGSKSEVREMFSGFLKKEGGGRLSKSYKKRWHTISSDKKMKYFKKKGGKMSGSYSLVGCGFGLMKNQKAGIFAFYIKTDKRTYNMRCDLEEDLSDWFSVLEIIGCSKED